MLWSLILLSGLAMVFVKLGVLSVTVKVLGMALHLAVIAFFVLLIYIGWNKFFGNKNTQKNLPG